MDYTLNMCLFLHNVLTATWRTLNWRNSRTLSMNAIYSNSSEESRRGQRGTGGACRRVIMRNHTSPSPKHPGRRQPWALHIAYLWSGERTLTSSAHGASRKTFTFLSGVGLFELTLTIDPATTSTCSCLIYALTPQIV